MYGAGYESLHASFLTQIHACIKHFAFKLTSKTASERALLFLSPKNDIEFYFEQRHREMAPKMTKKYFKKKKRSLGFEVNLNAKCFTYMQALLVDAFVHFESRLESTGVSRKNNMCTYEYTHEYTQTYMCTTEHTPFAAANAS
jgi:hypothetical protein